MTSRAALVRWAQEELGKSPEECREYSTEELQELHDATESWDVIGDSDL